MLEIILTVVLEVAKCVAPCAQRQLSYLLNYNSNFEELKKEVNKLIGESANVQHRVDEAKRKGEKIFENVEKWLVGVNKIIVEAQKFFEDEEAANKRCFKRLCPSLKTRYQLSKKAATDVKAIVDLLDEATRFHVVSYRTIPEDIRLISNKEYEAFESRMSILKEILSVLSNPNFNMIGVYGMGGIGKTTLVKEVCRQVKRGKLFDCVVFAEVSQTPDIKKIQTEIASKLGVELSEEIESGRAARLWDQLKLQNNILVVLDDIWARLDLDDVGIPMGDDHRGCKVLLTSRSENVLSSGMDSQQNFPVDVLNKEEAWSLFKKKAGDYIEGPEYKSVATEVTEECAGLPVSIVTVASALRRRKPLDYWKDVLQKLRAPSSTNFKNVQPKAYSAIKLSYDKLENDELQKTFLLIAYTYITSFDELLIYGMGLDLFQCIYTVEEAQRRVRASVLELKASCMLLDGNWGEDFSMHDVVRDVAISIASTEHRVFTARNELVDSRRWQNKDNTSIVLHDVQISELPKVLECPQLKLFSVRAKDSSLKIPENCFERMIELKVLHLAGMHSSSLPSSLRFLTNLQTLCFQWCKLEDMAVIGDLKKLEFLCFAECRIKKLPVEVGQLTVLKSLDLRSCYHLKVIPPNVISKLYNLEELHIGGSFTKWEVDGLINTERRKASLDELEHLSNLTSLEIQIKDAKTLPRDLTFSKKLERYKILIGEHLWFSENESWEISRRFKVGLTNTTVCLKKGHIMQLKGIQDLCLDGLQDMKNVLYQLEEEGFPQLKHLQVRNNPDLMCLIDSTERPTLSAFPVLESLYLKDLNSLEKICQGQLAAESFGKSKIIKVEGCNELKTIFPFSIARGLSQLEEIEVSNCPNMEVIFDIGGEEESKNNSEVSQLRSLKLNSLPQLVSFSSQLKTTSTSSPRREESTTVTRSNEITLEEDTDVPKTIYNEELYFGFNAFAFPSLKKLEIIRCPKLVDTDLTSVNEKVFPNLEELKIDVNGMATILKFPQDLLCRLKRLAVELNESTSILSLDRLIHRFNNMKVLKICGRDVEWPSENYESDMRVAITYLERCPELKHILQQVSDMANLVHLNVCWCSYLINLVPSSTSFQNLTTLTVWRCDRLINIVTSSTAKSLVRLRKMSIDGCHMMTEIVANDEGDAAKGEIIFSELEELMIASLRSLTSFCSDKYSLKFPSLELVIVDGCPEMKNFCGGELSTPKLRKVEHMYQVWWKGDLNSTIQHIYQGTHAMEPNLENLELRGIKVERTWQKQVVAESYGLQNLRSLIVDEGVNLRCIFTSSIVKSFVRLQNLEICECPIIEEIVIDEDGGLTEEERKEAVSFPQLKFLKLKRLGKLKKFCSGDYSIVFPSLKRLEITGCPEFIRTNLTFVNEKAFPNLEELKADANSMATMLQFAEALLCKLNCHDVVFDESTLSSSIDFLMQRFHKKKILKISGDWSEWSDEECESDVSLVITEVNSSELKHFLQHESNMDNWVDVDIRWCRHLINLVPSSTSFHNLTTLNVSDCGKLIRIVTSSTAKSLVRLRRLSIYWCDMITEIVANDEGDEAKDEIVFSELKELIIVGLDSLTSFYSGNCTLKFPSLELLIVGNCPKMKIFYGGELSAPKLREVKKDEYRGKGWWKGDLNSTIQQLHERMEEDEEESEVESEDEEESEVESEDEEEEEESGNEN